MFFWSHVCSNLQKMSDKVAFPLGLKFSCYNLSYRVSSCKRATLERHFLVFPPRCDVKSFHWSILMLFLCQYQSRVFLHQYKECCLKHLASLRWRWALSPRYFNATLWIMCKNNFKLFFFSSFSECRLVQKLCRRRNALQTTFYHTPFFSPSLPPPASWGQSGGAAVCRSCRREKQR